MAYSRSACLAWLASGGLSPEEQKQLLTFEPDPGALLAKWQSYVESGNAFHLPDKMIQALNHNANDRFLENCDGILQKHGIKAITFWDSEYPEKLRPLPDAPSVLFYLGDLSALKGNTVSMIGSRNASYKGMEATRKIAEELSKNEIRIVSGLAYGIDSAAHKGCLKGGSPTIAVLGCGLDQNYPAENAYLKKQILDQGGAVISEYAPGEKPLGWHFPVRNRIISGLGDCLAVLEARIRSGSMTTVNHALNQGKDVFVYPGEPGAVCSEGNHQLLRDGGIYFTSARDLMEDMRWLDKKTIVGQNSPCASTKDPSVSQEELKILQQLEYGEQSFDQLCDALSMPASQLNVLLSFLQIRGLIIPLPGKLYKTNHKT